MAYSDHFDTVQKLYIAYYQRPAEPQGLVAWAKRVEAAGNDEAKFKAILADFAYSDESKALYGGDIGRDNIASVIRAVYKASFGHEGDSEGRDYYYDRFIDKTYGVGDIVWTILDNASDVGAKDKTTVENKVKAATRFTEVVAGKEVNDANFPTKVTDEAFAYKSGAVAVSRDFLQKVTDKANSIPEKMAVEALLMDSDEFEAATGYVPIPSGYSKVLTFSADGDKYKGGNGDDVVYAPSDGLKSSLDSNDDIDGGNGRNTLKVDVPVFSGNVIPSGAKIKHFQVLDINVAALNNNTAVNVTTTNTATDVEEIKVTGNSGGVNVNASKELESVRFEASGTTSSTLNGAAIKDVHIGTYNTSGTVSVKSDSKELSITADNVLAGTNYQILGKAEDVTIEERHFAGTDTTMNFGNSVKSLTLKGNTDAINLPANARLEKFDISGVEVTNSNKGKFDFSDINHMNANEKVEILLNGDANDLTINQTIAAGSTIDLGGGNDRLLFATGGSIHKDVALIDGGAGRDSVDVRLVTADNASKFKNFEVLVFSAGGTVDMSKVGVSGLDSIEVQGATTVTANNTGSSVDNIIFSDAAGGNLTLGGTTSTSFTVSVESKAAGTETLDLGGNVKKLNIVDNSGFINSITLTGAGKLEEIVLTEGLDVDKGTPAKNITVTGTLGSSNSLKLADFSASNTAHTFTVNAAANAVIKGGAGNDSITVNQANGSVFITGGGGDDNYNVAANTVAGNGMTVITDASANDVIVGLSGAKWATAANKYTSITAGQTIAQYIDSLGLAIDEVAQIVVGNDSYLYFNDSVNLKYDSADVLVQLVGYTTNTSGAAGAAIASVTLA